MRKQSQQARAYHRVRVHARAPAVLYCSSLSGAACGRVLVFLLCPPPVGNLNKNSVLRSSRFTIEKRRIHSQNSIPTVYLANFFLNVHFSLDINKVSVLILALDAQATPPVHTYTHIVLDEMLVACWLARFMVSSARLGSARIGSFEFFHELS
jgi:hypothetical protein